MGLAEDHGIPCVAIMFFRGGRSLGSRNYFPKVAKGGAEDDVIIRAFLLQYYGGREAPKEILVSRSVPEAAALAEMLSAQSGHKVAIKSRVRGDRARWVEMAVTNARHGAELRYQASASYQGQLEALAKALDLAEPPSRLECFDISHTGGEATVASCVVFGSEGPLKSDYRRFNIEGVAAGDDYGAMNQVLTRRYARVKQGEVPMPDVLLIDGGPGQLAQAIEVLTRAADPRPARRRRREGSGPQARARELVPAGARAAAAFARQLARITLDPADTRRSAPVRDHGAPRAPAEGAHALAARGHPRPRPEAPARAAPAVRRTAGRHARGRRRPHAREGNLAPARRVDL